MRADKAGEKRYALHGLHISDIPARTGQHQLRRNRDDKANGPIQIRGLSGLNTLDFLLLLLHARRARNARLFLRILLDNGGKFRAKLRINTT